MKKIKFILMVLSIPLLASCVKGLIGWDCDNDYDISYVYFDNYDNYGIRSVGISLYRDSLTYPYRIYSDYGFNNTGGKQTGVELLLSTEKYYANLNNYSHRGEHFLLFMDQDRNILLTWDLRDTTQRWADESLWTMDSSFREISCRGRTRYNYYNTYTFSDEDFMVQE